MSVLDIAMGMADAVVATLPQPMPDREILSRCRLVAHRGEHDNTHVMENTLDAFRAARDAGVWGFECDVRWTADCVPVICHDPSPARVFGAKTPVAELTFEQLRAVSPLIPSLEEVVAEFGGRCHLMLEIKSEPWARPRQQADALRDVLAGLEPVSDYHLLSLQTAMFERVGFAPAECCLPVAETNIRSMSRQALARGYAGISGHYLLLSESLRQRHAAAGQRAGTGFPASANCLRRELNRGIDWVFSDHAVRLQALRDAWLNA